MQALTFKPQQLPSKIVCVGRNYVEHIAELGNEVPDDMVVFNKPASAITTELKSMHCNEQLHYEAELCFLVKGGQFCAVGLGLDLTKRELQSHLKNKGLPWERAKAFDGSALFSEFMVIADQDINKLSFEFFIDGVLMQQATIDLMIYTPEQILNNLQSYTTLVDDDIVMTGTPKGVGKVNRDSVFTGKLYLGETLMVKQHWQAT